MISSNTGAAGWARDNYASTKRLSGSGSYEAEAHATLIEGDSYEGEQVFSGFSPPCATRTKVNRKAKTCRSPRFDTEPGEERFAISGHSYNHGNDGGSGASTPRRIGLDDLFQGFSGHMRSGSGLGRAGWWFGCAR